MTYEVKLVEYTANRLDDLIEILDIKSEEEWDQLLSDHSQRIELQFEAEFEEMEMDA